MKNTLHLVVTVLFLLLSTLLYSQGDDPCTAINLTAGTSCSYVTYDNTGFTDSGIASPGCGGYSAGNTEDVWYSVVIPSTGSINISTDAGGITSGCLATYSGTCVAPVLIDCYDNDNFDGNMEFVTLCGRTPGDTIWIRFWEDGGNAVGTFDLCVTVGYCMDGTLDGAVLTDCNDSLYDSGGNLNDYGLNENVTVVIHPAGATSLVIYVHTVNLHNTSDDTLFIYDGPNNTYPILGEYTRNAGEGDFTLYPTGNSATIRWTADGSDVIDGYRVAWEANIFGDAYVSTEITCNGANDGEVNSIIVGSSPYSYEWFSDAGLTASLGAIQTLTNQSPDTFWVQMIDANGCSAIDSIILTEPDAIIISETTTDVLCNGDCDGTISINATGGTGTLGYSWDQQDIFTFINNVPVPIPDDNTWHDYYEIPVSGLGNLDGIIYSFDSVCLNITHPFLDDLDIFLIAPDNTSIELATDRGGDADDFTNVCFTMSAATTISDNNSGAPFTGSYLPENGDFATINSDVDQNGTWKLNIKDDGGGDVGTLDDWTLYFTGPFSNQTITNLCAGSYNVTVTDANACTVAGGPYNITEPPLALTVDAGLGQTICNGETVNLTATGSDGTPNYNYEWSTTEISQTIIVSPIITTIYTVTITDDNGCTSTDVVTVTVNSLPTAGAGGDVSICNGENTTITGTGGGTYDWDIGLGAGSSHLVSPSITTTYTLTVTDGNGCTDTDDVIITVNSMPTAGAGANVPICIGENTTITGTGGGTYNWDNGLGAGISHVVSPVTTTTYTVTVTDGNNCTDTDNIMVTVNPLPPAYAGEDQAICSGESATLTASGGTSYNWDNGLGAGISHVVSPLATTTYTVTVTDGNFCTNTDNVVITVNPLPTVSFSMPQSVYTINDPVSTIITFVPPGGVFSGPGIMAVDNTFHPSTLAIGFYDIYYTVTDGNGCVGFDMQTVEIVDAGGSISGLPTDLCNYSSPVTLTANISPPSFPNNFLVVPGLSIIDATHATFDPSLAPTGLNTIQYLYNIETFPGSGIFIPGGIIEATTTIHNISGQASLSGLNPGYCVDAASVMLTGTPAGGEFLGAGITNSVSGIFDPTTTGVGNTSVQYVISESVCTDTTENFTDIYALPFVDFVPLNNVYNVAEPITALSGNPLPILPDNSSFFGNIGITNTGNGTADFDPSVAGVGSHDIIYTYTDVNGCTDTKTLPITINVANATINGIDMYNSQNIYCYDSGEDTLVGEPLFSIAYDPDSSYFTLNGVRFGAGIDSIGIDSIVLYPDIIGPGTHDLNYYYYDSTGSGAYFWITESILIDSIGNIDILTSDLEYCVSESQSEITGEIPLSCNGQWSYSGTESGGLVPANNTSAWFFPNTATVGNYDIYYECTNPSTGCMNFDTAQAFVYDLPTIIGTDVQSTYNYNISYPALTGNPAPGIFVGPGVITNIFYPTVAGEGGPYDITYTYTDGNGCSNAITQQTYVVVAQASIDTIPSNNFYCKDGNNVSYSLHGVPDNTPAYQAGTGYFTIDGIVNGTGIVSTVQDYIDLYPDSLFAGSYSLSYYYTDTSGTEFNVTYVIQIDSIGFAGFSGLDTEYCVDDNVSTLISDITTLVGTHDFTGAGVSYNGSQFEFNPSVAGANILPYTIDYEFTHTQSGCKSSSSLNTTVHALPTLEIITDTSFCANNPINMVYGSPAGSTGFLTGLGLISTGDTVDFNPAVVSGFVTIFYEYTDTVTSCSNIVDTLIHVKDVPELDIISIPQSLCLNAPIDTITGTINSLELGLGIFGGNGIIDNSNGTATFDPLVAGVNTHEIYYTYIAPNGCLDTIQHDILVHDIPSPAINVATTSLCENNIPIDLAGYPSGPSGVYDINGVITSLGEFDPGDYLPGDYPVSYTFTNTYGCSVTEYDTMYVHQVPYNLSFSPNMGCLNDTVSFSGNVDCSDAIADIYWSWALGTNIQEDTTDILNPNVVFTDEGIFNVNLEITSEYGCLETYNTGQIEIFDKPDIDFDWEKECFGDTILFTNTPNGLFADSLITWYFDDGDSLIGNNATHYYQLPGIYTVTINVENTAACMGTKSRTTVIREKIDSYPYFDDFEGASSSWYKETRDTVCSWLLGLPDSLPAYSGTNTWNTNHDTLGYQENSSVISPCFDITGLRKPMITMKIWCKMRPDNDGAVLQYSLDYGEWENIGTLNSGINWYDSYSIDGMPGGQSIGWSNDTMFTWTDVRQTLDNIIGLSSCIRFRIAYGSDDDAIGNDFAFDDVWIGERLKMVLFEHFTNASESECAIYDPLIHSEFQSNSNLYDVIDIRFHSSFPGADQMNTDNPADQNSRISFYSVPSQLPYSVIDGNQYYGATKTWIDYYNTVIPERSLIQPIFNINLETAKSSSSVNINADITALTQIIGKNITFNVAVIEKEITSITGANGMTTFDNVVKKLLPDAAGTLYSQDWTNNQTESIALSWDYENVYNHSQVYVVAFLQDEDTKEVYQVTSDDTSTVFTEIDDFAFANSQVVDDFTIYPNPTANKVIIWLNNPVKTEGSIQIFNNIGELIETIELNNGSRFIEKDLSSYSTGLYLFKYSLENKLVGMKKVIKSY